MPSLKTKFLGIRRDVPVESGFNSMDNVDMYVNELRQRNPSQAVDANPNTPSGDATINVIDSTVYMDIGSTGTTTVRVSENSSTTGLVSLGPWTTVKTGADPNPRYTDSQFGVIRVDGQQNCVISGTTAYNCGVASPTVPPNTQENPGSLPPPPSVGYATSPLVAGVWAGTPLSPQGLVKITSTFVKQESGVDFESPNGWVAEISVADTYSIGVDGANLPADYTEIRVYRTTVGGETFYPCTTVDKNGTPVSIWGDLEYGFCDDTDAALVTGTPFVPVPSPAVQGTPVNSASAQREPSIITVFYTYVKVYPGGGEVESSPSDPAEFYSLPDTPFRVSHTASSDPHVTKIRIYRSVYGTQLVNGNPTYFRAAEVNNATATTSLTLTDDEIIAAGDVLLFDNDQPPPCIDVVQANDQIWYLGDSSAPNFFYISPEGRHEGVDLQNYIAFDDNRDGIVGGVKVFDNVLIFKRHATAAFRALPDHEYILISATIGCVSRNTISVIPTGAIWLSFSGVFVWEGVGRPPVDITHGKVWETIISPAIQDDSTYSGVYYPERDQYILSIRPGTGSDILLCYWFRLGEWTTYSFSEHPISLASIDTPEGRRWLYLKLLTGLLYVQQGDVPPTPASSPSDSISTISDDSAITGASYDSGTVFYINGSGDVYEIERAGSSYLSEVNTNQPNAIRLTQVDSAELSAIYADATTGELWINNYTTSWGSGVNIGGVRTENFFLVGVDGDAYFSSVIVDPTISPVLVYDPEVVYSVNDIVFNPFFQGVRKFDGYTTVLVEQELTNGNPVRKAWPWPDILNTGTPPNAGNALYLYDDTSTLNDLDQIHFDGEFFGVATGLTPGITYEARRVTGNIYTVWTLGGTQVTVGGNHYHHTSIVTGYAEDSLGWAEEPISWLPIATSFTYGDVSEVQQENWTDLSLSDYTVPVVKTFNGTTISTLATFSVGDSIFPNALAQTESATSVVYFPLFEKETNKRSIYRLTGSAVEHIVLYPGVGEFNYDTIAPLRVTDDEADIYDGSAIRTFKASYNWGFLRSIDAGDTLPVIGKNDKYWRIITDDVEGQRLWFSDFYTYVDITSHPTDMLLLSNGMDDEVILLHSDDGGGPSTVYWVQRKQLTLLSEIESLTNQYYDDGTANIYGVNVTIESCPIKLAKGHVLKRLEAIYLPSRSENPAIGVMTVTPGQEVLEKYHQSGETLSGTIENQDLWWNGGSQNFDTETIDDAYRSKKIRLQIVPDGAVITWSMVAGDMFATTPSSLKLYPLTIEISVEEDKISYE